MVPDSESDPVISGIIVPLVAIDDDVAFEEDEMAAKSASRSRLAILYSWGGVHPMLNASPQSDTKSSAAF